MRYIFEDLIDIRAVREDRAAKDASAKRARLEAAQALVERAKKELDDFRVWRVTEKDRLYDQVLRKVIRRSGLDQLKEMLAALDEKEALYMQRIQSAGRAVDDAKVAYDESRAAWRDARANLEKLEEHKSSWLKEEAIEAERHEDLEMEEFGTKRLGGIGDELEY